jgi:hypothetical protein
MRLGQLRATLVALMLLAARGSAVAQAQKEASPQQNSSAASEAQSQTSTQTDQKPSEPERKQTEPSKPMTPAEARQAHLLADTQKLYQLTQELKAEVAKSNKDTLSIAIIKKAEEVEKLAKNLKERMRAAQ